MEGLARQRERRSLLVVLAVLACGGAERIEVPRCAPPEVKPATSVECTSTAEVLAYRQDLGEAVARHLRWEHSPALPIGVEFDAAGSVDSVCVASEPQSLPWAARQELVRGSAAMRSFPAGPPCLAGTRLDVTEALVKASTAARRSSESLASCLSLRGEICLDQNAPVCGVFPDGTRRTYANACAACENSQLKGWAQGACSRM